jgi:hypothetical protein
MPHSPVSDCQPLDHFVKPLEALDGLWMMVRKMKELHPEFFRVKFFNRFGSIRL